jgi:hypothetical protein
MPRVSAHWGEEGLIMTNKYEEALRKKIEEKLGEGSKGWLNDHLIIIGPDKKKETQDND